MVAALGDYDESISPGGIDDNHIKNMPAKKPSYKKDTESNIADNAIAEIFKHFCKLV